MKKIFGITTMLVGAALLTAGCTSDNLEQQGQKGNKPIQLAVTTVELDNSAIADGNTWSNSTTRAQESSVWTAFSSGDAIKTYIVKNSDGSAVPETGSGWTTYSYNGTAWTANPVAYYPGDYSSVDLTAIYPSTVATNATSFSVQADQTTPANYKASDLLTYKGTNIFPEATLPVAMEHKMARIKVKINTASTVAVTGIAINNVNLTTGTFSSTAGTVASASAGTSTVTIQGGGNATTGIYYCGVIPPQTHAASALITLTTASGNVTYTLGTEKAFESGKEYTLDLTVNTAAVGTTINIGTWAANGNVTVNPTVKEEISLQDMTPYGVKAVDLGLPSGRKWANMNVGATSVTGYGTYFAWGETGGLTVSGSSSTVLSCVASKGNYNFGWSKYKWSNDDGSTMTKYTDTNSATLELGDDAARVNWGGNWRMPTLTECQELIDNTTVTYYFGDENYNGVHGVKLTSKNNSNFIFLPAAGYCIDKGFDVEVQGSYGNYWSSSLNTGYPDSAKYLLIDSGCVDVDFVFRCFGFPVRPVQ